MKGMLIVGAGGAIGAMLRYGISLLPVKSDFPILTLCTNLLGALMIGFFVGMLQEKENKADWLLFLKTGLCGGFTTFSTFSLEALTLFQKQQYGMGITYAALSVGCCMLGVALGNLLATKMRIA